MRRPHVGHHLPKKSLEYESLDYDPYDTSLSQRTLASKPRSQLLMERAEKWILVSGVALGTALVAILILWCVEKLMSLKNGWVQQVIDLDVGFFPPFLLFVGLNMTLVLPVLLICTYIEPAIGGVGVPEVVAYLNSINMPRVVRLKTLVGKIVCTILSVSGSMTLGPEAPIVQSGGIIGAGLSQGKASSFKFDSGLFTSFRNDRDKLQFICAGTAAGMASAFGAPISGVLLVLEEGASFWDTDLILFSFFCGLSAKFFFFIFLQGFIVDSWGALEMEGYLFFGPFKPNMSSFKITAFVFYVLLGVMGGLLGMLWNKAVARINNFRAQRINPMPYRRIIEGMLVAFITSVTIYLSSTWLSACHPLTEELKESPLKFRQFNCAKGEWNDMATLFMNGMEAATRQLWHNNAHFSKISLVAFSSFFYLLMMITLGIAVPGGLLIPCFFIGGGYGRFFAQVLNENLPWDAGIDETGAAIIASVAVLSGFTRLTVALAAIIIESTNEFTYAIPLGIAVVVAKWVADIRSDSIIHEIIHVKKAPFLEWDAPSEFRFFTAKDLMHGDPICLDERDFPARINEVLKECDGYPFKHQAFPVVQHTDPEGQLRRGKTRTLRGVISRKQLVQMLANNQAQLELHPSLGIQEGETIESSPVSLLPYTNQWPYTVSPNASISSVYPLFRLLGLRWLIVADERNNVQGIITRKDLIHEAGHLLMHDRDEHGLGLGNDASDPDDDDGDDDGVDGDVKYRRHMNIACSKQDDTDREESRDYYDEAEYAELRQSTPCSLHALQRSRAADRETSLPENLREL